MSPLPQTSTLQRQHAAWRRRRVWIGYAVPGVLGLLLLLTGPGERVAGILLLVIGATGIGREIGTEFYAIKKRSEQEKAAAARAQLKHIRHDRARRKQQERQEQRLRAVEERERLAATKQIEREAQERQAEARALKAAHTEREAERIGSLTDAELRAELTDIFSEARRLPSQAGASEWDILLTGPAYVGGVVARCLLVSHVASVEDMQSLDALRRDSGAAHAYLIAFAGFTPVAVRLAQRLPMTLVEAHLLANWKANHLNRSEHESFQEQDS